MSISVPFAGELKHRISLFRRVDQPSADYSAQQIDSHIWTGRAKVEPTGSNYRDDAQIDNRPTHRIWIRSISGKTDPFSISHGVIIKFKTQMLQPTRVTDANGQGKWTVIEAMELGSYRTEGNVSSVTLADEVLG